MAGCCQVNLFRIELRASRVKISHYLAIAVQGHLLVKDGELDPVGVGGLVLSVLNQDGEKQNRVLAVNWSKF